MVFYKNGLQETGPCPHFTLLNLVAREPLVIIMNKWKKVYRNSDFCQVFIESVISVPLALWLSSLAADLWSSLFAWHGKNKLRDFISPSRRNEWIEDERNLIVYSVCWLGFTLDINWRNVDWQLKRKHVLSIIRTLLVLHEFHVLY